MKKLKQDPEFFRRDNPNFAGANDAATVGSGSGTATRRTPSGSGIAKPLSPLPVSVV